METLRRALFNSFVIVVIFLVGFNGPVLAEELETIEPLNESVTLLENETNESIIPNSCEGELCVQYEENGVESDDSLNEATTSATDDYNSVIVASTNDESQNIDTEDDNQESEEVDNENVEEKEESTDVITELNSEDKTTEDDSSCTNDCDDSNVIVDCDVCDREDELSAEEPKKGTLVVYYQDYEGNALVAEDTTTEEIGTEYQTSPKEIEGYTLYNVVGQPKGTYMEEKQEVFYIYQVENSIVDELGELEVHHIDEIGNEIAETETSSAPVGNPYQTEPKEIPNYKYLEVDGDEEGTYVAGTTIVTYRYQKVTDEEPPAPLKGKVIANYINLDGNKIAGRIIFIGSVGSKYSTFEKTIDGYNLVRVEGNTEGFYSTEIPEVYYIYETIYGTGNTDLTPGSSEVTKPGIVIGANRQIKPPHTKIDTNLKNVYFLIVSLISTLFICTIKRTN